MVKGTSLLGVNLEVKRKNSFHFKSLEIFLLRCSSASRGTRGNSVGSTDQGVKLWEHWTSPGVGVAVGGGGSGQMPSSDLGDTGKVSHRASLPGELHFPKGLAAHSGVRRKDVFRPSPLTPIVPKTRQPDWRALSQCILGLVVQSVQGPSSFVIRGADSALQERPREAELNRVLVRRTRRASRRLPRGGAVDSAPTPPSCPALCRTGPAPPSWSHS